MTLGTKLHALRIAKVIGLREVAKETGVSASTISRLERGIGRPYVGTMGALCRFYGVNFTDLIDDPPEMTDEETDAYLIGHGYNLDKLRDEINALIDELKATAKEVLARKGAVRE